MKLLLLGANGQLGWELRRALAPLGEVLALGRAEADLEDLDGLRRTVDAAAADVVVNAAAWTAVDAAETSPERAWRVNAEAVGVLAAATKARDGLLVHYSTDYVFDGTKETPYAEDDRPHPLSAYGRSKLGGEQAIAASGCRHLVFRTSWVYAARGGNFARTMLRLAAERDQLRVIADQIGAPTGAELIADVSALCLYRLAAGGSDGGLYHLVAGGATSWHGYASFVIAEARRLGLPVRVADAAITAIGSADYPLPAARPKNSRLATTRLEREFGLRLPDWTLPLRRTLSEIAGRG